MKRLIFSWFLVLFAFNVVSKAQVTTLFNTSEDTRSGKFFVQWQYTQLSDTTSTFNSPQFNLPGGYEFDAMTNSVVTVTMKHTKPSTSPVVNSQLKLIGLMGGTADTVVARILRPAKVGQGVVDTSYTFKLQRAAQSYRVEFINTGGKVATGKVFLVFVKQNTALKPL